MKQALSLIFALCCFGSALAEGPDDAMAAFPKPIGIAAPHTHADIERAIDTYIKQLTGSGNFSGVVLWQSGDAPAFSDVVGTANRKTGAPIMLDSQFNIASIGKLFTHIAILQLIQDGKLKPTDTIGASLPDYPNATARTTVTIQELLDMRSGIGDIFGPQFAHADHSKIRGLQDYLRFFADTPLAFQPGTKEAYSNGGYIVLGLIIEKVSGQSYYDYVRTHIFEPAGMTHTGYPLIGDPQLVVGYGSQDGHLEDTTAMQPARGSSAGGAYSTASDLLALVQALNTQRLLDAQYAAQLNRGPKRFAVAGGAPGTNAFLYVNFETSNVLVVLSNFDPPSAIAVGQRIMHWIAEAR